MDNQLKNIIRFCLGATLLAMALTSMEAVLLMFLNSSELAFKRGPLGITLNTLIFNYFLNIGLCAVLLVVLRIRQKFLCLLSTIACSALFIMYVISWKLYELLGFFLNLEGFRFFWKNPVQVTQHILQINLYDVVLIVIVGLLALVFMVLFLRKIIDRFFTVDIAPFYFWTTGLLTLMLFLAGIWNLFPIDNQKILQQIKHRVSPQATLMVDLFLRRAEVKRPDHPKDALEIVWSKHVSLEEFYRRTKNSVRKNSVFLFVIESLRSDVLDDSAVMPNIYALRNSGLYFPNTFSSSSHSDYSDIALLSSQYPLRTPAYFSMPESPEEIFFPRVMIYDVLKSYGYQIGVFSAQNENWSNMRSYLDTGNIDMFYDSTANADVENHFADTSVFKRWLRAQKTVGKIDDGVVIDQAIQWVSQKLDQNVFLYFNLQRSHFPYTWPETHDPKFKPYAIDFRFSFGNYPESKIPIIKNRYYNALSYIDLQIGRFIQFLKDQNLYEESIIVVTGDTGQAFFEHDYACHGGALYNEVVNVPLIVKLPGSKHQRLVKNFVKHIDIPPTICYLLNIEPHPSFQGRNVINEEADSYEPIFITVQSELAQQDTIIWDHWKFTRDYTRDKTMLFNLDKDFSEKKNLVNVKEDIAELLDTQLSTWRTTQINYYRDRSQYEHYYPPRYIVKDTPEIDGGTK